MKTHQIDGLERRLIALQRGGEGGTDTHEKPRRKHGAASANQLQVHVQCECHTDADFHTADQRVRGGRGGGEREGRRGRDIISEVRREREREGQKERERDGGWVYLCM